MAHAVAIAAEPAAEAAEQVDNHQDDQDRPKRHGALREARGGRKKPPPPVQQSIFQAVSPGLIAESGSTPAAKIISGCPRPAIRPILCSGACSRSPLWDLRTAYCRTLRE